MERKSYQDYTEQKAKFFRRHSSDEHCTYTSPLVNGRYHIEHCFEDGAVWYEINENVHRSAGVMVEGIIVQVNVELFATTWWNTEYSGEQIFYERA